MFSNDTNNVPKMTQRPHVTTATTINSCNAIRECNYSYHNANGRVRANIIKQILSSNENALCDTISTKSTIRCKEDNRRFGIGSNYNDDQLLSHPLGLTSSSLSMAAAAAAAVSSFQHVQIIVDRSSNRHEIIIKDYQSGVPLAICKRMYSEITPFKVYSTKPNYPNQFPSHEEYDDVTPLYTYADIRMMSGINSKEVVVDMKRPKLRSKANNRYAAQSMVGSPNQFRIVSGNAVSTLQFNIGDNNDDDYHCTLLDISSESDPFLIVCLGAIHRYLKRN
jgi:hypothetical protein